MKTLISIIIATLLIPCISNAEEQAKLAVIEVQKKSWVEDNSFTLGDIAEITDANADRKLLLSKINLGSIDAIKRPKRITQDWLNSRLRLADISLNEVSLQVPTNSMVERLSIKIPEEEIRTAVEMMALNQLNVPAETLIFNQFQLSRIPEIPMGDRSYQVSSKVSTQKLGRVSFTVNVDVNGKSEAKFNGSANVDVKVNVLNTAKPLAKETIIGETDLQIVSTILSKVPRDALLIPKQILGMQTRKSLTLGQFVSKNDVIAPILVQRNQPILLILQQGSMRITTKGTAMQDGALGQTIRVRNERSKKMVSGKVENGTFVRVIF